MNARAGGTQRVVAACALAASLDRRRDRRLRRAAQRAESGSSRPPPARPTTSGRWRGCGRRSRSSWAAPGARVQSGGRHGHRGKPHRIAARLGTFGADFEQVADPTAPEFRVNGAIFLSFGIFGYGRCSGTAVRSRNASVVITAGHCVNSGGRRGRWFSGKSVFVPAYRYGQRPFGVFPVRWIDSTKQWRANGSENFDVGAMVVGRNAGRRKARRRRRRRRDRLEPEVAPDLRRPRLPGRRTVRRRNPADLPRDPLPRPRRQLLRLPRPAQPRGLLRADRRRLRRRLDDRRRHAQQRHRLRLLRRRLARLRRLLRQGSRAPLRSRGEGAGPMRPRLALCAVLALALGASALLPASPGRPGAQGDARKVQRCITARSRRR